MKIARHTDTHLILEDAPVIWALFLVFFSLFFAAQSIYRFTSGSTTHGTVLALMTLAVLASLAVTAKRTTLLFDRATRTVTWRERSLLGKRQIVHQLGHVAGAEVDTRTNDGKARLVLVLGGGMDAGRHPVTRAFRPGPDAKTAADAVNAWLQLDRPGPSA